MRHVAFGTYVLGLLAGCAPHPGPTAYLAEAGTPRGDAAFGNATMNNVLVQSGQVGAAESLGRRFAETVPTTINFAFDSVALDAQARAVLAAQAGFIRAFPEVRFAVYGHADAVGPAGYNEGLGLARARAAVAYLASQGVDASRLEALASEGETMPVVPSQGPERANRRTVTVVTGFVQGHRNVMNGRYAAIIYREYVGGAVPPTTLVQGPAIPATVPSSAAAIPTTEGVAGGGGASGGASGGD